MLYGGVFGRNKEIYRNITDNRFSNADSHVTFIQGKRFVKIV